MALVAVNFVLASNEDWFDTLAIVTDPEGAATPYDLTGSSFKMQLRKLAAGMPLVEFMELSTDNGRLVIGTPPSDGKLIVNVEQEVVEAALKPGVYDYDLLWTLSDGRRVQLAIGTLTITLGVTRDDN